MTQYIKHMWTEVDNYGLWKKPKIICREKTNEETIEWKEMIVNLQFQGVRNQYLGEEKNETVPPE